MHLFKMIKVLYFGFELKKIVRKYSEYSKYVKKHSIFFFLNVMSFQTKATTVEQLENLDKVEHWPSSRLPVCSS